MGRTQVVTKYEITPEIKELQALALQLHSAGHQINIDITQDLVTFNGFRKMTRDEARTEMNRLLEVAKDPMTTSDFPDQEQLAKEAKAAAKAAKKHREPGAPPELRTLLRRAKRIYKKTFAKRPEHSDEVNHEFSLNKATSYIDRKAASDTDRDTAEELFTKWLTSRSK
jgi:hypothetical protein